MAEIVRELPGDPSNVLNSLAGRLTTDGWEVRTRGALLQAVRDGRSLSLTVLGSARGTRVHAEGSLHVIRYLRSAIGPESAAPKEFSLKGGGANFGATILAGLGLTVVASLFLLAVFCQPPSSSEVKSSTTANSTEPVREVSTEFSLPSLPPSATPTLRQPTPARVSAAATRRRPQPTLPPPAIPSVTPEPPPPTPTGLSSQTTPVTPTTTSAAITQTPTPARSRPSAELRPPSPSPTPTLDPARLRDAYGR